MHGKSLQQVGATEGPLGLKYERGSHEERRGVCVVDIRRHRVVHPGQQRKSQRHSIASNPPSNVNREPSRPSSTGLSSVAAHCVALAFSAPGLSAAAKPDPANEENGDAIV